jgi:hypothetical protein
MHFFRKKALWLIFVPLLITIPFLTNFVFPYGADFSDVAITHYPNAKYIQNVFAEVRQIPLWANNILSGYPFAANPLSNLFYPPHWLAILLPLPFGLNLVCIMHMAFAGIGMYIFLKEKGISEWPAFWGALSFELMPKLVLHFAAGHISTVYAVSWYPWLLVLEQRIITGRKKNSSAALLIAVLGLIILADVRWAAYGFLLWVSYSFYYRVIDTSSGLNRIKLSIRWFLQSISGLIISSLLAFALLLPMLQYTSLSTRGQLSTDDHFVLSMPVTRLLGFVIPDFHGYVEWTVYAGAIAICLVLALMQSRKMIKGQMFWLLIVIFACLFSLGDQLFINKFLTMLPGMNLLRVPPRIHILSGLAFSIISASVLDILFDNKQRVILFNNKKIMQRLFFIVCSCITLMTVGIWVISKKIPWEFLWASIVLSIGCGLIEYISNQPSKGKLAKFTLIGIAVIDLLVVNVSNMEIKSSSMLTTLEPTLESIFKEEDDYFRVYSPSYSLEQQQSINYGLELVDGIDPMQLSEYQLFMMGATGVKSNGYSVTIPPYQNGNPAEDNRDVVPDPYLLGLLNVKYVISAFPIETDGMELISRCENGFVYVNKDYRSRAWLETENGTQKEVNNIEITPNRILISVDGPGKLVLSEIIYPGWQASVDGKNVEIGRAYKILRTVQLEAGQHVVEFIYKPFTVITGIIVSVISWILLLGYIIQANKNEYCI